MQLDPANGNYYWTYYATAFISVTTSGATNTNTIWWYASKLYQLD